VCNFKMSFLSCSTFALSGLVDVDIVLLWLSVGAEIWSRSAPSPSFNSPPHLLRIGLCGSAFMQSADVPISSKKRAASALRC
jgi:hypothetical protein